MGKLTDLAARHALWLVVLASAGALATALVAQYGFDLQPCVLCVYQRWPYVVAAGLAVLGLVFVPDPRGRALVLALAGLAFAASAAIAGFHVGVEQHWWQGTTACGGGGTPDSLEALRNQILGAPVVRCDDIAWQLFGVSMAGYNFLYAGGLAAASLILAWRRGVREGGA